MKQVLATKDEIDGFRRKIGWFKRLGDHLYFDLGGLLMGTHTSYHKDGNIFRTSPATNNKAVLQDKHLRLKEFKGWYQLGITMIAKKQIKGNPVDSHGK